LCRAEAAPARLRPWPEVLQRRAALPAAATPVHRLPATRRLVAGAVAAGLPTPEAVVAEAITKAEKTGCSIGFCVEPVGAVSALKGHGFSRAGSWHP